MMGETSKDMGMPSFKELSQYLFGDTENNNRPQKNRDLTVVSPGCKADA
jgi:hypothetical protein